MASYSYRTLQEAMNLYLCFRTKLSFAQWAQQAYRCWDDCQLEAPLRQIVRSTDCG